MQRSSEILLFNHKGADKFQTTFFIVKQNAPRSTHCYCKLSTFFQSPEYVVLHPPPFQTTLIPLN